jgi:hypothetical protein
VDIQFQIQFNLINFLPYHLKLVNPQFTASWYHQTHTVHLKAKTKTIKQQNSLKYIHTHLSDFLFLDYKRKTTTEKLIDAKIRQKEQRRKIQFIRKRKINKKVRSDRVENQHFEQK